MLPEADLQKIRDAAKKHRIASVFLLCTSGDVIVAVDGADPRVFFRFYGDLLRALSSPVDVYDLAVDSAYSKMIHAEGEKIYG